MEEIAAVEKTIESLRKGWGAGCEIKDYRDFENDLASIKTPDGYEHWLGARCQSCRAQEVIAFLEKHAIYLREEEELAKQPNAEGGSAAQNTPHIQV